MKLAESSVVFWKSIKNYFKEGVFNHVKYCKEVKMRTLTFGFSNMEVYYLDKSMMKW